MWQPRTGATLRLSANATRRSMLVGEAGQSTLGIGIGIAGALGLLAAVQGGLLGQTRQEVSPPEAALDHAISAIEMRAVPPTKPRAS